ncbi:hypothetical protein EVAR_10648_1 [Eumeta japonica]|uniref:Uncharacterized protein n=1 Tax=Eumeta variegata TaxID=151549 RepID=A0A4C1U741_EUMVA|nr:hypothetical protein EVAR_10648_1 [Eumeta japonica]
MRIERSICTPRYRTLVCHSTSCPRSLSFVGMARCWPVRRAAVFVTFTATRHHGDTPAMLFFDIDYGLCRNGRRFLLALIDYRQWSAALLS